MVEKILKGRFMIKYAVAEIMASDVPIKEVKKLAGRSLKENMPVLEALADQDRRLTELPRRNERT
jgi:hypothetical protein